MTALALWNPGDQFLIWGVNVLLQVTVVAAIALIVAASAHRSPAVRYGILCSSLLLTLLSPAIARVMQLSGSSLFSVSLMHEAAASTSDIAADVSSVEPQSVEIPPPPSPFDDVADTSPDARGSAAFEIDPFVAKHLGREGEHQTGAVTETEIASVSPPPEPKSPAAATAAASVASPRRTTWIGRSLRIVMPLALLVWMAGAAVLLTRLAVGWRRLAGILRSARSNTNALLCETFERVGRALHIQRMPELVVSQRVPGPIAAGLFRPRVVLPERIVDRVSPEQLRDILVHELAHVVRRDQAVVLLQNVTAAIFWLHPLVKVLNRQLSQAREEVCDNYVLAATDAPSYSRTLLALAEMVQTTRPLPGAVGLLTSRWKLERRVAGLLDERRSRMTGLTARGKTLVVALSLAMTTIAALGTMKLAVGQTEPNDATVGSGEREANSADVSEAFPSNSADSEAQTEPDADGTGLAYLGAESRPRAKPTTIRGRVLDPNGQPAVTATVFVGLGQFGEGDLEVQIAKPIRTAVRDDGTFNIEYAPRALFKDPDSVPEALWDRIGSEVFVAAAATGYGPAWVRGSELQGDEPLTLRLVADQPIVGRLISIDGAPVAGVRLHMKFLESAPDENIQPWIESLKGGRSLWKASVDHKHRRFSMNVVERPREFVTDGDGRFRIAGVGRDRIVRLFAAGPTAARQLFRMVSRDLEPLPTNLASSDMDGAKVYGARSDAIVVIPSQPIVGMVRDADTGRAISGVTVESYQFAGSKLIGSRDNLLRTTTDDSGRFRLEGMPKGAGNRLLAVPGDDLPYFMREIAVPEQRGFDPIELDIALHRGQWIEGNVVDKATGKPVLASLHYLPFLDNEFAKELPEFTSQGGGFVDGVTGYQHRYQTRRDGSFRIVGLPGRAIVGAVTYDWSSEESHRRGAGSDLIEGLDEDGQFPTYRVPLRASRDWPNVMVEVNPAANAESLSVRLEAEPGIPLRIRVTDPTGTPVGGYEISGQAESSMWGEAVDESEFTVAGLGSDEGRTILILHAERNIGRVVRIAALDDRSTTRDVRLEACCTVSGRLVDPQGEPITRAELRAFTEPSENYNPYLKESATTDNQGRFEFTHVPPGGAYRITGRRQNKSLRIGNVGFEATAGATIDLGSLTVGNDGGETSTRRASDSSPGLPQTSQIPMPRPAPSAEAADQPVANPAAGKAGDVITIRGRVVGPNGEPSRAQLWLGSPPRVGDWRPMPQSIEWTPQSQSYQDGRFELSIDRKKPIADQTGIRPVSIRIAATADGLGFAWADVKSDKADDEITLQLVNDVPIHGRLLTADGQPVPGVSLHISQIYANTAKVEDIVKNASRHSGVYTNWPAWPGGSPTSEPVVTDADGRFRIEGLGANRWVRFEALGGGIGATRLSILTHAPPDAAPHGAIAVREGLRESSYFASFTHIAVPGRTLQGVVTDAETGQPLNGVRVVVNSSWASRKSPAITGPDGRYEITGVPKAADYELELQPTGSLHFNKRMKVIDPPGLEPIEVNVALATGIRVRGRVTDAESGEAVRGTVIYNPLFPNDHVARLGEQFQIANPASSARIDDDGSYELSVLPGPGAIAAQIDHSRFVTAAVETDELKALVGDSVDVNEHGEVRFLQPAAGGQARGIMGLSQFQAVALVNPTDAVDAIAVDLTVVPSRSRPGTIVDQDGKPLAGVDVIGLGASGSTATREPLESAAFEIEGLTTGRPRTLLFLHRERALGAKLVVTGDEMSPITVRLSPTGTIAGRLVDQFGEAIQNGHIELMPVDPPLGGSGFWDARMDEDGRFRVSGLINDCGYSVRARTPEHQTSLFVTNVKVAAGQSVDLGEFQEQDDYRFVPVGKTDNE